MQIVRQTTNIQLDAKLIALYLVKKLIALQLTTMLLVLQLGKE